MKKSLHFTRLLSVACLSILTIFVGCNSQTTEDPTPEEPITTVEAKNPTMPVAFLAGVEYAIPQAVYVDENGDRRNHSVYLINDSGEEQRLNGDTFTPPTILHGKNITLRYVADNETLDEFSVPVLNATRGDNDQTEYSFDKMFVLNNVDRSELTEKGTVFYGSRDFSATFANAIDASFDIHIKALENFDNFESVTLSVADAYDPTVRVNVLVSSDDENGSDVYVNGSDCVAMSGSFKDYENGFKLSFNNNALKLYDALKQSIYVVDTTYDGKEFTGFKSGLVNISIGISAPRATSAVCVVSMNNQEMTINSTLDEISPFVVCAEDIATLSNLNDTVKIPAALAYDVLDPSVKTKVSVFTPTGEIAVNTQGKEIFELDAKSAHYFVAKELGEYAIQYSVTDRNGNSYDNAWYSVFITDDVAPTLTIKNPVKNNVELNSSITISNLEIADNCTKVEDITVLITVHFPNGDYKVVKSGEKFTFNMKGTYYFRYSAIDEHYNINTQTQTVICK